MELYEKNDITYIINNFNIVANNIEKQGDNYKIISDEGEFLLKSFKKKDEKIYSLLRINQDLLLVGFNYIPIYICSKTGNKHVLYNRKNYCIEKVMQGEKVKFRTLDQCKEAVKLLASFHQNSKKLPLKGYKIRKNVSGCIEKYNKRKNQIIEFKEMADKRILRTELDERYKKLVDFNVELLDVAINILVEFGYNSLRKRKKTSLVVDKFYSNTVTRNNGKLYFTNLDYMKIGYDFYDLGKFIRRIMFKKEFLWDFNKAKSLIESYEEVNPLSREEKIMLLAVIIYPSKFYKIGKNSYKKCFFNITDNGYYDLTPIENNMEKITIFVENYYKYYTINTRKKMEE